MPAAVKMNFLENIGSVLMNERNLSRVIEIDMDRIYPNPNQPRRKFNENDLNELAVSIKTNGLIQPIIVRRVDIGYELVAGERRLRAARICGMKEISCIIVDTNEKGSAIMSLVENMQRRDLSFFEEAEALSSMIKIFGLTQEELAVKLGKNQSTIANKLRLLNLPRSERNLITEFALFKIESPEERLRLIKEINEKKLNVENTERLIERTIKHNKEIQRIKKCKSAFKDVRIFVNTINHAVEVMQAAGINAEVKKNKEKEYTEYIVRIPNRAE